MQRIAAVWHASPQKMVGVLFALLLAAAMAVGSGANFTTSSANPGNYVTAGKLTMSNSKANSAIFQISPFRPDDPAQTGSVSLANTGDGNGATTLTMSNLADTNAANPTSLLSTKLNLKVEEFSDAAMTTLVATRYNGLVSAFPSAGVSVGTWTPGVTHYFKFSITWPGTANGGDNVFQGANSSMDFNWNMVQA
jgi:spore coat-associated protein N